MSGMKDYMLALHRRFHITSPKSIELKHDVESAYDTLHAELNREQQKLLLRFLDAENRVRDEEKLDSFFSGFRLANGIHTELNTIPAYSFEDEDENRAREIIRQELAEED